MRDPRCAACGTQDDLKYHHLVPHGMGGTDDETNLLTLCEGCQAKANGAWRYSDLTHTALARHSFLLRATSEGVIYE